MLQCHGPKFLEIKQGLSSAQNIQNLSFTKALFSFEKFLNFNTVALSFVFDNYYSTIDYVGLKNSSRKLQTNYAISFCFRLYLVLHACAARVDVMGIF